jgi:tetratricopeptide (TPR) repeat protein
MDEHQTDLQLRELKRIKWLLVLIACGVLLLPASLAYLGWEVASMIVQGRTVEDSEDSLETIAEDLFQQGKLDELRTVIDQRAKAHPNDADVYWYRGRMAVEEGNWEEALRDLEQAERLAPNWKQEYTGPLLEKVRAKLGRP